MTSIIERAKAALGEATPGVVGDRIEVRSTRHIHRRRRIGGKRAHSSQRNFQEAELHRQQDANAALIALAPDLARIAIAAAEREARFTAQAAALVRAGVEAAAKVFDDEFVEMKRAGDTAFWVPYLNASRVRALAVDPEAISAIVAKVMVEARR